MLTYIALGIFFSAFALIIFDVYDKSIIALSGAILMVILRILSPEEAIAAVEFETIFLLVSMMILVNIASKSGVFEWLNVKIASLTKGNPLFIFLFFSIITGISSAFLDNVSTVILIVPLTIELVKGMGKDPRPYIFAEIIFANVGGALTLVGDPSNIIIGGASGLNFLEFVQNLWIPILSVSIFTMITFIIYHRKKLKPVSDKLIELSIANLIIRKIKYKFLKRTIHKDFVIKVTFTLFMTLVAFVLQSYINLPTYVIAFTGAMFLAVITSKRVSIHDSLRSVEWTTLFFFAGLFIMVAGVEKTGILDLLSDGIANSTENILYLSLIVLWGTGLTSMVIDNIPFVTVMVPVVIGIQTQLPGVDTSILWWALSMGACLGGCGTLVGGSANVVSADLARKNGAAFSFLDYTKFAFPLTLGMLAICSTYLILRLT